MTSTYDGMAIAYATCAYLASNIKAYTLFSTHYLELTKLSEEIPCIRNVHLQASLDSGQIIFLYRVEQGSANRSYGIEVAKLAGIPVEVLSNAKQYLNEIQDKEQAPIPAPLSTSSQSPVLIALSKVNPDTLTAKNALDLIYQLKQMAHINEFS